MNSRAPGQSVAMVLAGAALLIAFALVLGRLSNAGTGDTASWPRAPGTGGPSAEADRGYASSGRVRVTALGDSVMLAAAGRLSGEFPDVYVDAETGRTVDEALEILRAWAAEGRLGEIVLIHIGNNGAFNEVQFEEMVELVGPTRKLVFVNLHVPRPWEEANNEVIGAGTNRRDGVWLVDWHAVAASGRGLLWEDGVHLRPLGAEVYVETVAPYLSR